MGAVLYTFDSVPGDEDLRGPERQGAEARAPWNEVRYLPIYADLEAGGWPVPKTPAAEISRDDLIAHLQQALGDRIKALVEADAAGLYAGKKPAAVAAALSSHRRVPGPPVQSSTLKRGVLASVIHPDDGAAALAGPDAEQLKALMQVDKVDLSQEGASALVDKLFPAGTPTRAAIDDLTAPQPGPPVEVMADLYALRFPCGPNELTAEDIAAALGS